MTIDPASLFAGLLLGICALSALRDLDRRRYEAREAALLARLVPGLVLEPREPEAKKRERKTPERQGPLGTEC
jgi:hypothetical protein